MDKLIIGIAEGRVTKPPHILITYALGSCVGICLYDKKNQVAGMAHIVLPCQADAIDQNNPFKFADAGLNRLLDEMVLKGAQRKEIRAKIAGGAEMFPNLVTGEGIGQRNVQAVRNALKAEKIRIVAEDTGEDYGRTILLDSSDGTLEVRTVSRSGRKLIL